jgi:hypothetical protein
VTKDPGKPLDDLGSQLKYVGIAPQT